MKKLICVVLDIAMVFVLCSTVFASEPSVSQISISPNTNTIETDNSDYEIVEGSYVRIWENPNVTPDFELPVYRNAYGERYESRIVNTAKASEITKPDGQPRYGYGMPSGGAVFINTSGGHKISISLSTPFGKSQPISIGVGYAYTAAGVGGLAANIPANNHHYLVMLRHNYTVNRVEYKHYKYLELLDTFYMNKPILDSIDAFIVQTD